jgi:ADP-ribose pyrophosphatase YjhB (NUDIX family)
MGTWSHWHIFTLAHYHIITFEIMNFSSTHPLNIFRFCPKCGHEGFIFDNIKAFTCATCSFRFYINASTAVAVIIELPDDRIVLARRKHDPEAGKFDFPGGFVDILERAEDAAIREVKEELGVDIYNLQFLATFPNEYPFGGISYYTTDIAFTAKLDDPSKINACDDVSEAVYELPEKIDPATISFDSVRNILKIYIEQKK